VLSMNMPTGAMHCDLYHSTGDDFSRKTNLRARPQVDYPL